MAAHYRAGDACVAGVGAHLDFGVAKVKVAPLQQRDQRRVWHLAAAIGVQLLEYCLYFCHHVAAPCHGERHIRNLPQRHLLEAAVCAKALQALYDGVEERRRRGGGEGTIIPRAAAQPVKPRVRERLGRGGALGGVAREQRLHQRLGLGGHVWPRLPLKVHVRVQDGPEDVLVGEELLCHVELAHEEAGLAHKGQAAGEQLVCKDARRPQVCLLRILHLEHLCTHR